MVIGARVLRDPPIRAVGCCGRAAERAQTGGPGGRCVLVRPSRVPGGRGGGRRYGPPGPGPGRRRRAVSGDRRTGRGSGRACAGPARPGGCALRLLAMAFVLSIFTARLVQMEGLDSATYRSAAQDKQVDTVPIPVLRGDITASNGTVLAMTVQTYTVFADPVEIPVPQRYGVAANWPAARPGRPRRYWACWTGRRRRSTRCWRATSRWRPATGSVPCSCREST